MTNKSKRDWGSLLKPEDFDIEVFYNSAQRYRMASITEQQIVATEYGFLQCIAAHIANAIIRKEIEKAPRVYGAFTEDLKRAKFSGPLDWTERYHPQPSHTARLICIEEIKRD